jgi:hypothetical protein
MDWCARIDGWQLLAYLDRRAAPEITAHIANCPDCAARAARLADQQRVRAVGLARQLACPSTMELGEYHLGWLTAERAEEVRRHIAGCPRCTEALQRTRSYLGKPGPLPERPPVPPDPTPNLVTRLKVLVAEWVQPPSFTPAYGVRGTAEAGGLYRAGDVQIALEVQDDFEQPGRKALLGLITGGEWHPDQVILQALESVEPALCAEIDALGNFVLAGLRPGSYQVRLVGGDIEIQIVAITC